MGNAEYMGSHFRFLTEEKMNFLTSSFVLASCLVFACLVSADADADAAIVNPTGSANRGGMSCETIDTIGLKAAQYCGHKKPRAFSWKELKACKGHKNCPGFNLPSHEDFKKADEAGNKDGYIELEEWESFYGCKK